jgi:hypothetical protein
MEVAGMLHQSLCLFGQHVPCHAVAATTAAQLLGS